MRPDLEAVRKRFMPPGDCACGNGLWIMNWGRDWTNWTMRIEVVCFRCGFVAFVDRLTIEKIEEMTK